MAARFSQVCGPSACITAVHISTAPLSIQINLLHILDGLGESRSHAMQARGTVCALEFIFSPFAGFMKYIRTTKIMENDIDE